MRRKGKLGMSINASQSQKLLLWRMAFCTGARVCLVSIVQKMKVDPKAQKRDQKLELFSLLFTPSIPLTTPPPAAEARMCKKCWRMIVWHLHIWFFMLRHLMESLLNRTSLSVNSLEPFNDALLSQKLWQIPHVTRGPFSRCTWHKHGSSPSLPLLVWRKHVFILEIIIAFLKI